MKKLFAFLFFLSLLPCGCNAEEPGEPVSEPTQKEEQSELVSEPLPQEEPEDEMSEKDYIWENLVAEIEEKGFSEADLEKLESEGYKREELKEMSPDKVALHIEMSRDGVGKETVDLALSLISDEDSYNSKKLVISGTSGTKNGGIIEKFIENVEKNEVAAAYGIMAGYTMPYYFELTFEPDGFINLVQIYKNGFCTAEFSEIYDTETFWCFSGEDGEFSVPKMKLYWEEKPQFSEEAAAAFFITPEKAIETAQKIMLSGDGKAIAETEENSKRLFGSYCEILEKDYSESASDYFKELVPNYEGTFDIDGKPYHLVCFYNGDTVPENFIGYSYYVSAENAEIIFTVSMVNGELHPIAFLPKPLLVLK